jgi:hypothetical protein
MRKPPRTRAKRAARPPGAVNKERRSYNPGGYDYYKAEWERRRNDPDFGKGNEWLTEAPALAVPASPFLATLDELGKLTQVPDFQELRNGIMNSLLIDKNGNWAATHVLNVCNPRAQEVCEGILEAIGTKKGSRRVVLAKVAAEMQITANSFEAAHARLTLLWRAWKRWQWRQLKSQDPPSNSNS